LERSPGRADLHRVVRRLDVDGGHHNVLHATRLLNLVLRAGMSGPN
jgi:hypothetical protein